MKQYSKTRESHMGHEGVHQVTETDPEPLRKNNNFGNKLPDVDGPMRPQFTGRADSRGSDGNGNVGSLSTKPALNWKHSSGAVFPLDSDAN